MSFKITVIRPLPPKELHPNAGKKFNHHKLNRLTQDYKNSTLVATWEVMSYVPSPAQWYTIHLKFYLKNKRATSHADQGNYAQWFKAGQDGIAEAMGVNDRWFKNATVEFLPMSENQRGKMEVEVTVTEVVR